MKKKKDDQELKELFKSVKKVLAKKGLLKKEISSKEKEATHIPREPKERRRFPRLSLSRGFKRTIISRINYPDGSENIKSFATNISIGGLCLETKKDLELRKNSKINLRLFFYGDKIPMMKIQAHIIWERKAETVNYYGVSFIMVEKKDKAMLSRYIESNITKEWDNGTERRF